MVGSQNFDDDYPAEVMAEQYQRTGFACQAFG